MSKTNWLDVAIGAMLAIVTARIVTSPEPRAVLAGYVMMAGTAAAVPIFLGALRLGFKKG